MGHRAQALPAGALLSPGLGLSVPLYNEEDCVEAVAEGLLSALAGLPLELVLVNNGSEDATAAKVNALAVRHRSIRAMHLVQNAGYGGGILAGLNTLETPVVGWTWGDGQIHPEVVRAAYDKLVQDRLDLVKSHRVERRDGIQREMISSVYNRVMRVGFGLKCADVNGCPKLMTAATLDRLQLRSLDWFLDPECLLKATELGLRIGTVPAVMHSREGGASKVKLETVTEFAQRLWSWRGGWRP